MTYRPDNATSIVFQYFRKYNDIISTNVYILYEKKVSKTFPKNINFRVVVDFHPSFPQNIHIIFSPFFQTSYNQHLGIQKEFLKLASQVMKFTYTIAFNMEEYRKDTQIQTICHAKAILNHNIDLCLGAQTLDDAFTLPSIYSSGFDLYAPFREPKLERTYFLSVFEFKLWICMFFTIFLMIILLFIYAKVQKTSNSFLANTFNVFQIAIEKNSEIPKPSYKVLTFVIGLFLFLLASSFSANLITFLLKHEDDFPIKEFSDVWTQQEYSFCVNKIEFKYVHFVEMDKTGLILNGKNCPSFRDAKGVSPIDVICKSKNAVFLSSIDIMIMQLRDRSKE